MFHLFSREKACVPLFLSSENPPPPEQTTPGRKGTAQKENPGPKPLPGKTHGSQDNLEKLFARKFCWWKSDARDLTKKTKYKTHLSISCLGFQFETSEFGSRAPFLHRIIFGSQKSLSGCSFAPPWVLNNWNFTGTRMSCFFSTSPLPAPHNSLFTCSLPPPVQNPLRAGSWAAVSCIHPTQGVAALMRIWSDQRISDLMWTHVLPEKKRLTCDVAAGIGHSGRRWGNCGLTRNKQKSPGRFEQ